MLLSGFATRYRVTAEGKRQITAINLTGDFVDLPSLILKTMDHSVGALSDLNVVAVPHANLRSVIEAFPHLGRLLWLSTLLDTAITREWVVGMGRLTSAQHLAHLICELYVRLKIIGHADRSYTLPFTQSDLGDALGLSVVHVNRTLQELRAESLFTWEGGVVTILDWQRLTERAEFDPQYLHLQREPR